MKKIFSDSEKELIYHKNNSEFFFEIGARKKKLPFTDYTISQNILVSGIAKGKDKILV